MSGHRRGFENVKIEEKLRRQKVRLENLVDVVYGVAIVMMVVVAPTPGTEYFEGDTLSEFLSEHIDLIIAYAIVLFLLVVYWLQSNAINGILSNTDNRHSSLVLAQLIVMLLFFYFTVLSAEVGHPPALLAVQSAAIALMGIIGIVGLLYAAGKGGLLLSGVTKSDVRDLRNSLIPEPLTAALTLPVAIFGIDAWSLAWLSYPVVIFAVRRILASGSKA